MVLTIHGLRLPTGLFTVSIERDIIGLPPMQRATESIRVLHVDDEPDFADMAATMVERENDRLEIETAMNASEGIDRLAHRDFDCVVSDYDMPRVNGIEFLDEVRNEHPDIPFILFTGKGSEEIASDAISAGVTDYLQKERATEQYQLLAKRIIDAVEHHNVKTSYREIFEKVPDGIVIHEPTDGSFTDMNEQYAELFGYEREELMTAGFAAIHPNEGPYSLESARQRVREAADRGPQTFEWPGLRKDGEMFWAEVHLTPTQLHGNNRILAVVRDISDRKERVRQLEQTEARFQALAENFPNGGVHYFDEDLRYQYVAGAGFDESDTSPEDLAGNTIYEIDLYSTEVVDTLESVMNSTLAGNEEALEVTFENRIFDLRSVPIRDADGEVIGGFFITQDIMDQRRRERELEHQNDQLEQLARIVSHDLRNPLNVAQGRLDLALEECNSEHLSSIEDALERSQTLIDDLLTLSREGGEVSDIEATNLGTLAENCWHTVGTNGARITIQTDRAILADRSRLQQLLENLYRNAVEHGNDDVTVTVGEMENGFYVADDGPGIPEEDREKVFEPGFSTGTEGTGYGLQIVSEIAMAHSWNIRLTESDRGGARFEITGVEFADG